MDRYLIIFKLGLKFSQKYFLDYLKSILMPLLITFVTTVLCVVFLIQTHALELFALKAGLLIAALTIIIIASWKMYLITYALIPCADFYIRNNPKPFKYCVDVVVKNQKKLLFYATYYSLIFIGLSIPCSLVCVLLFPDFLTFLNNPKTAAISSMLTFIPLFPYLYYGFIAYYYKKPQDSNFNLFLNCYKKLDATGIINITVLFIIGCIISCFPPLIQIIADICFAMLIFPINTFWYSTRIGK